MRVLRDANLSALSKSLRDSLAAESLARILACVWSSSTCRVLSDSFNAVLLACCAETLARASSSSTCRVLSDSFNATLLACPAETLARASSSCCHLCKRNFFLRQLSCFVPLKIPYSCTCDQYDRSHRSNGPTCDPLQARGTCR
jgi:hypothetical protein